MPDEALALLPFGIQAQIMALPDEKEREAGVNTYLNSILSLLSHEAQATVFSVPTLAERIKILFVEYAKLSDDNLSEKMGENL